MNYRRIDEPERETPPLVTPTRQTRPEEGTAFSLRMSMGKEEEEENKQKASS